jgi:hypothetical protein
MKISSSYVYNGMMLVCLLFAGRFLSTISADAAAGKEKSPRKGKTYNGRLVITKNDESENLRKRRKGRYSYLRTQKKGMTMKRYLMAGLLLLLGSGVQAAERFGPDVEVNVPPEVFSSGGQRGQPCSQCCIYQNQNYSEGAVVKAEGVLLQCQRDEKTISTNPLVWRRVRQ